jgi:hypothetical protein
MIVSTVKRERDREFYKDKDGTVWDAWVSQDIENSIENACSMGAGTESTQAGMHLKFTSAKELRKFLLKCAEMVNAFIEENEVN